MIDNSNFKKREIERSLDRSKVQRIHIRNEVEYKSPYGPDSSAKKYYQSSPTLASGVYGGYRFRVVMNYGLHPCAYIEVPDKEVRKVQESQKVHGGVTYVGNSVKGVGKKYLKQGMVWVGWDYSHSSDYTPLVANSGNKQWTTEEIVKEVKTVINDIKKIKDNKEEMKI